MLKQSNKSKKIVFLILKALLMRLMLINLRQDTEE